MRRWLGLGLVVGMGLGISFGGGAWAQPVTAFDGQYVGKLTLTKLVSGDCTEPPFGALYPLSVSGGNVRFLYTPRFDTVLHGRIDRYGNFKASYALRRGRRIEMTGAIQGTTVNATIVSPSCHYSFQTGW